MRTFLLCLLVACCADPDPVPDAETFSCPDRPKRNQCVDATTPDAPPLDAATRGDAATVDCPYVCPPGSVAACTWDGTTCDCHCEAAP